jgi:hypothetical protein
LRRSCSVGDLRASKGKEEEQERAAKFSDHGHEVVAYFVWESTDERQGLLLLVRIASIGPFHERQLHEVRRNVVDIHFGGVSGL